MAALLPAQRQPVDGHKVFTHYLRTYDKDHDGKVTAAEYPRGKEQFARLDRDRDGALTLADFESGLRRAPGARAALWSPPPAPRRAAKVGDLAPDFDLPLLGMKDQTVKLSSFRGVRPVALIFGSYT